MIWDMDLYFNRSWGKRKRNKYLISRARKSSVPIDPNLHGRHVAVPTLNMGSWHSLYSDEASMS
jgi:hypothetical protein